MRKSETEKRSSIGARIFLAAAVAGCLGCQGQPTEKITMSGGSLGGGWSAISEGVTSALRREMPGAAVTHEVGLDGANAAMVDSGRVQLGLLHSAMAQPALAGEYPYKQKHQQIRGISRIYPDSAYHFVVTEESGITSIEEIRQQKYPLRLNVMYQGSLMETSSRVLLEAYGMSYEDIESWGGRIYFRAYGATLDLMKDGRLDAIGFTVQYPETRLIEASLTQGFRVLPISEEAIQYVNERLGTYRSVIPAGTYRFAPAAIPTFADVCILIAYAGMPDEQAYRATRALHQNLDYLHSVHKALSRLEAADMPRMNLPLHPGAERYYREAGLL